MCVSDRRTTITRKTRKVDAHSRLAKTLFMNRSRDPLTVSLIRQNRRIEKRYFKVCGIQRSDVPYFLS